ncbi:MAG: succinyl-diaminopimelate desuccinylase [Sphingomonas sp.]|nr:succinyl-diaminopimelate desuccinylase [Sphingomonas sp.]
MIDTVELTKKLVGVESVTPARGAVFDALELALTPLGFAVERFICGEAPDGPVENLIAIRGEGERHFAFAGHLDVVPGGEGWTGGAFTPEIRGDLLFGRGTVDMKGAIAAFVAAVARTPVNGTISLLITGDEEGPAIFGTRAIIDRLNQRGLRPDLCLVGEPTSVARLGDTIKIGRRGSVNFWITVPGHSGHVAYPHLTDNPAPKLARALAEIDAIILDSGTEWFQPSNIEITELATHGGSVNVIPGSAATRLSIRFNALHQGADLVERIRTVILRHAPEAEITARISGEAFLTQPGTLSDLVSGAIEAKLGITPELSTSGGTSDARFLVALCPVIEFGLLNATMHKLDEAVALRDLHALTDVYAEIIARAFA